jgi:hypothetical protein
MSSSTGLVKISLKLFTFYPMIYKEDFGTSIQQTYVTEYTISVPLFPTLNNYSSLQMPLFMHLVENQVGSLYTWPIVILRFLFNDTPTHFSTLCLINFFYGNRVPCAMAVQLVRVCNDQADDETAQQFYHY